MQVRTGSRALVLLVLAGFALTACNRKPEEGGDQQTGSMTGEEVRAARADWSQEASMHVDSANAAYRAKNYDAALEHYEEALKSAKDSKSVKVTSYFGIYMVQQARGDSAAAAAAMAKAQEIAPEASLMHGGMPMGGGDGPAPKTPQDSIHRRQ